MRGVDAEKAETAEKVMVELNGLEGGLL